MDLSKLRKWLVVDYLRRQGWMNENLTLRKALEMGSASFQFLAKREILRSYPLILKVDISPRCHMACTICVHAKPRGDGGPLDQQRLRGRMSRGQFEGIVNEARERALAISMYYMGDPYAHSEVDSFCRLAFDARVNVHLSTSFSFPFSDQRIAHIAESGVTHLTICIDGATQELYGVSRVGGRLDWVLSNLRRLAEYRNRHDLRYPKIEIQCLSFPHNRHQVQAVRCMTRELGADDFFTYEGYKDNWADRVVSEYVIHGPKVTRPIPRCYWPYVLMLIKYNGDVIPCCVHRIGEQYTERRTEHILGNVFESGVRGVWNNGAYQAIRRVVSNPGHASQTGELEASFCHGCSAVNRTNQGEYIDRKEAENYPAFSLGCGLSTLTSFRSTCSNPYRPHVSDIRHLLAGAVVLF
ncbi:MAG: SPASM domain-containing protein [Candidatus Rokubacteria bacterium]|nr:SPASM domain-containing protein [Candidatus Rokubacteria bacterium]